MTVDKFLLENIHHAFSYCTRVLNAIAEDDEEHPDIPKALKIVSDYDSIVYKCMYYLAQGRELNDELNEIILKIVDYVYVLELNLILDFAEYYDSVA